MTWLAPLGFQYITLASILYIKWYTRGWPHPWASKVKDGSLSISPAPIFTVSLYSQVHTVLHTSLFFHPLQPRQWCVHWHVFLPPQFQSAWLYCARIVMFRRNYRSLPPDSWRTGYKKFKVHVASPRNHAPPETVTKLEAECCNSL